MRVSTVHKDVTATLWILVIIAGIGVAYFTQFTMAPPAMPPEELGQVVAELMMSDQAPSGYHLSDGAIVAQVVTSTVEADQRLSVLHTWRVEQGQPVVVDNEVFIAAMYGSRFERPILTVYFAFDLIDRDRAIVDVSTFLGSTYGHMGRAEKWTFNKNGSNWTATVAVTPYRYWD